MSNVSQVKGPPLAADKKTDYWWVDSRKLEIEEGFNRREDYGNLEELASSIKAAGVKSALWVNKIGDRYIVRKGHRRTKALRILEKRYGKVIMVPIILVRRNVNIEELILDQITENSGLEFSPWEQAKVLRDLRNMGWSEDDMVERSGKTKVYVKRLLSLADAPQKLINLVREGRVAGNFAMDMIAEKRVDELLKKADENNLPAQSDNGELFPQEQQAKPERITRADLRPNSWKIFRKWAKDIDPKSLPKEKAQTFNWLKKMEAGELTEEDFKKFFK